MRVGLTGGIGSGKSTAAGIFAELGAVVIDADDLAREAVGSATEGLARIAERWPAVVRGGTLDRAALAEIVFSDRSARAELEAIVHPLVRRRALEIEAETPRAEIVVHAVPLLFEGDFWKQCDKTVLVYAPRDARIARIVAREGWSREEIQRRMAAQIDPEAARKRADYVIENIGNLEHLHVEVARVYSMLRQSAAH